MIQGENFYWSVIQQGYTVNPNITNLNNGGVSPSPKVVQDALERYNKLSNEGPSYFMWHMLDQAEKQERVHYLKNYWASAVMQNPKVKIHTSLNPKYSCAICGVGVNEMKPGEPDSRLFNKYKIHTLGIVWENIRCVRVTPHVYTTLKDLDKLSSTFNFEP